MLLHRPVLFSFIIITIFNTISSFSQTLPTAKSLAAEMGAGWNIGNTMEAPGGATGWGNPVPSRRLIDSVKASGIKTVRIPAAWDFHADQTTYAIDQGWMAQVKEVVDYCIEDSLFVVLNIHWDGGWLQSRVDSALTNETIRREIHMKQGAYWRQIATTFRDYDRHLLFASTNEPGVGSAEAHAVLMSFHQTFIDSVRATGGNNASRTLILQGPNTSPEHMSTWMTTMPNDPIADRLMVEFHFYPYQFCLMSQDADWGKASYFWGKPYQSTTDPERNATFGTESYTDSIFNIMKVRFVDGNIPILIGEMGAIKRLTLTGDNLDRHILSRRYFYYYLCAAAIARGMIPVVWDAGNKGDGTMTVFDRTTGAVYDLGLLNAIRSGVGLPKLQGDTSLVQLGTGDNSMKILYSSKDSLSGQVVLPVVKNDMTPYDTVVVRAYVNGETEYDSAGTRKYGYLSLSFVTMSVNWTWREASFGTVTLNGWKEYRIPMSTDTANHGALVPADPAHIDFFAVQAYSRGYRGTIYIDWILFKSTGGTHDTVYSFNQMVPEAGAGNVESISMIATGNVASDTEWETATQKYPFSNVVLRSRSTAAPDLFCVFMTNERVRAAFSVGTAGTAEVTLQDLKGRTIKAMRVDVFAGLNYLEIPICYQGVALLRIRRGDQKLRKRIICY
ncbi:MAG: glycoside hydrolase family 5 protein [Chitinispirillaceae bacterium]|nr:glycoside hydrolase family 5 protein [Chitinispirillaceae bacterium]